MLHFQEIALGLNITSKSWWEKKKAGGNVKALNFLSSGKIMRDETNSTFIRNKSKSEENEVGPLFICLVMTRKNNGEGNKMNLLRKFNKLGIY